MNHVFKVKVNDTLWHLVVEDEEDEKPNRLEIRVITKKPHTEIGLELPGEKCHLCKQKIGQMDSLLHPSSGSIMVKNDTYGKTKKSSEGVVV